MTTSRYQSVAVLLLGGLLVTCTRDLTAPGGVARIALAPQFAPNASPPGNALAIDQIRIQVIRTATEQDVVDKTYPFASGASLQLSLAVPLEQATDSFQIDIFYQHGGEVLFSGSQSAVLSNGGTSSPISVPIAYTGPGVDAVSLTLGPRDTTITSGDSMLFRVTVMDSGAVPDSVYVGWGTNNASQPVAATGRLVATLVRGTVTVRAVSPTPPGLRDSTTVTIMPKPAGIVKVSGDGQTGFAGEALPLPLVVQVNGSDNLGVPGVTVTFAAASGGGSVDSATVVTDSAGRASTGATLGATGAQTFTATVGTLSVTFGESAGAAPPKTWTGAISNDWTVGGNWNPAGVPAVTDSVIIPSGTANAPRLHGVVAEIGGLNVQSGATLTVDSSSLVVNGSITQAGILQDTTAFSVLLLAGPGNTAAGTWSVNTSVTGSYTLAGNVSGTNLVVLGALTLAGHTLRTTGAFTTAPGTQGVVTMTNAGDSLIVQGAAAFEGGAETDHLTAGTFVLGGSFAVSVPSGFDAGPSHLTVFNGAAQQTVFVFDTTHSNQFGSVEFRNKSGGVLFDQLTGINGSAKLDSSAIVTSLDTTFVGGGMAMNGGLTTMPGSLLKLGELWVNTTFSNAGTYAVTSTIFTGNGQTVPTGVTFPFLYCTGANVSVGSGVIVGSQFAVQAGTTTLSGPFSVSGNTFVQFTGKFVLNGHAFSTGGDFTVNQGGLLQMTNAADTLDVFGNAYFEGGNESGLLSAGFSLFFGNFTEGSGDPQAYAPSGSHIDAFVGGGVQTLTFGHPGAAGASHFQGFAVDNAQGALQIASDVYLMGPYAYVTGAPRIVHGGGQVVHFVNLSITGVTFDNVKIAYDASLGGTLVGLDSLTFENYDVNSAVPLIDISSPGSATSFLFDNMSFYTDISGAGGTASYLRVTDSAPADGNVLTIDINSGLVVTEGEAHTITAGGAVVVWNQP